MNREDTVALRARVDLYLQGGQFQAALELLQRHLRQHPQDVVAHVQMVDILFQCGKVRASVEQALTAASLPVADADLGLKLVQCLQKLGEWEAARGLLDAFAARDDLPPAALAGMARSRMACGEIEPALALVREAIEAGVDSPDEHYMHALLLQYTGDLDGAGRVLDACLERWQLFSGAAMTRSRLRKQTAQSNHLAYLGDKIKDIPSESLALPHRMMRAEFESARFSELDDLGRYEQAWRSLATSNAIMHQLVAYDRQVESDVTGAIIGRQLETRAANLGSPAGDAAAPIFIVGLPRTGTTLLDRMLSNHSRVVSAGEIEDFMQQLHWCSDMVERQGHDRVEFARRCADVDLGQLGGRYLRQTRWRTGGSRYFIDKMPNNYQFVDLIHGALPHARILHMVREPMDACFSNYKAMFGLMSGYSYDMQTLAHHYGLYRRTMDHWHESLPGVVLDVSYDALVHRPRETMQQVLAHCGLDLEPACLEPERNPAPVASPSSAQVRQAIHARGIAHWKRYAGQLEPMRLALEQDGWFSA